MNFTTPTPDPRPATKATMLLPLVTILFFMWGFSTVLVDSLIPKLKSLFALSYAEVMLTQFCFFLAYFVMSIPAGILLGRIGYIRGIIVGLTCMAVGGMMFAPAALTGAYSFFLVALFVIASGITMIEVAANPLVARLGDAKTASSRLTLAQAFNSLGTSIGPWVGATLILGRTSGIAPDPATAAPDILAAFRRAEAQLFQVPFLGLGVTLAALAIVFWAMRHVNGVPNAERFGLKRDFFSRLIERPKLAFGVIAIFFYVGAEISIGSFMTIYLMQPSRLGWTAAAAGRLVSLYWTGAMLGRFGGSLILRRFFPGSVLIVFALSAACLATISIMSGGTVSAVTIIAVGVFNSIMFPTIFALAIEGLGAETPQGSALLCTAIVGGAVIPAFSGLVADHIGLPHALLVPAFCYLPVVAYGVYTCLTPA